MLPSRVGGDWEEAEMRWLGDDIVVKKQVGHLPANLRAGQPYPRPRSTSTAGPGSHQIRRTAGPCPGVEPPSKFKNILALLNALVKLGSPIAATTENLDAWHA
jgi:hypothetical protein